MGKGTDAAAGLLLGLLGGAAVVYLLLKLEEGKGRCPNCNSIIKKGQNKCPSCGTLVRWE